MNKLRKFCHFLLYATLSLPLAALQLADTDEQDIRHNQFADQFEVLLVGEQSIPIVITEANTAITRGVAVLLSEAGRSPFSQHGLTYLTQSLNDVGWVTMVMPAPSVGFWPDNSAQANIDAENSPDEPLISARTGNSHIEQAAFAQHEQLLISQMRAIVEKSIAYPGFFLVIAQGTSAAWLTKIYAEKSLDTPDGLVVLSPYWPDRFYNQQLPAWLAATPMPVLDVFSPWDPGWSKDTVEQRKIEAVKSLKMVYRQRELTGQKLDQQQFLRLGKEIYGWLTYLGW